jgi:hypothetical protein
VLASEPFRVARVETIVPEFAGRCEEAFRTRPDWIRWIDLGLARASDVVTTAGPVCRLTVEELYRREAENWSHRTLLPEDEQSGSILLPVAVRTLIRISEIRSTGQGVAEAGFEWQWRLNQAGQRLGLDTSPRHGWAQLVLDDSGWRATRVEPGSR